MSEIFDKSVVNAVTAFYVSEEYKTNLLATMFCDFCNFVSATTIKQKTVCKTDRWNHKRDTITEFVELL